MKKLTIITVIVAAFALGAVTYATFAPQGRQEADTQATAQVSKPATVQELLDAVNAERAKVGVAPLTIDERLNQSAQYKADDMGSRDYLGHYDPTDPGVMNGVQKGYDLTRAGNGKSTCSKISENIHWATGDLRTTESSIASLMSSKAHREAILDSEYKTTGFGVYWSEKMVIVEHFCKP